VAGAVIEGAIFATLLKGTEGIIGISFKALGDLVERYESKVNGMDRKCHVLARNLDVLLKKSETADRELNALPRDEFRREFDKFLKKVNSPPGKWDWFKQKRDPSVRRAEKIMTVINNTSLLYGRIQSAHKVHAGYEDRLDALKGNKAKKAYEISRFLTGTAWTIAQVSFGLATMNIEVNDLVAGILGATNDLTTGPGFDTAGLLLDKVILPT
jgi:hypothetical protein